jgi:hypothetical protein
LIGLNEEDMNMVNGKGGIRKYINPRIKIESEEKQNENCSDI